MRIHSLISAFAAVVTLGACDRAEQNAAGGPGQPTAKPAAEASKKIASSVQDTTVTTKVKAALLADEQVKGGDIKVETTQGKVTLSGRAENAAQKRRAEQLAMNVDGVRTVENQIATP